MKIHKDKVAIITGGNSGIGLAVAKKLAQNGAIIILADYNEQTAQKAIDEIKQESKEVIVEFKKVNVANEESVKNMIDDVYKEYKKLDYIFNNAGIDGEQKPIFDYNSEIFNKVISINLCGVFYGMKYAIQKMKQQGFGSIVNTASILGLHASSSMAAYVASKHGVVGITKVAAIECANFGIRINAICPGAVLTAMVEEAFKKLDSENPKAMQDKFSKRNPLGRFANPHEIANVVSFLFSDEASYINGQCIALDGGETHKFG